MRLEKHSRRDKLVRRSVEIILENQCDSGAYIASPNFPVYRYSWFRDGSYIAHAMDRAGHSRSATAFHDWAANTILSRRERIARTVTASSRGDPLNEEDLLHTRYHADGSAGTDMWENFQLDGFGTWLWALADHRRRTGNDTAQWREAADLTAGYLAALWDRPCYDLWEEHPNDLHTYTLASIWAGLRAARQFGVAPRECIEEKITAKIQAALTAQGRFVKSTANADVDASLLALAVPYGFTVPANNTFRNTLRTIHERLIGGGGVHRYREDTYYGGGAWVLLTAWLSWVESVLGERDNASRHVEWVEAQAAEDGCLPEQVPVALHDPAAYVPWREKWGPIATPLLWSHAMYLIAVDELATPQGVASEHAQETR